MHRSRQRPEWIALVILMLVIGSACGAPRYDASTFQGKTAILDAVKIALTNDDCASAIINIEPLYNSAYTDNKVRMARASSQACAGGLDNLFKFIGDLADNAGSLAGPGFWKTMTKLFYKSNPDKLDSRITATWNATDAAMSVINLGTVISTLSQVNAGTQNVGSLVAGDRDPDANAFLMFLSMAVMGNMQARYGAPNPTTFAKGQNLGATASDPTGWTKVSNMDEYGCAYSAGILNFLDSIDAVSTQLTGKLATTMAQLGSTFGKAMALACTAGCTGTTFNTITYNTGCVFTDTQCAGTTSRVCPLALRDRTACTNSISNRASCSAAGIATFVSQDPALGWQ